MKVQVFIRSFGAPILLAVLLIVWRIYGMTPFQTFIQATFVLSYAIAKLLSDVKYINTVSIDEERISISFYTQYLNLKHLEFDISNIKEIKLSKRSGMSWFWPPNLDFKFNGEQHSFEILSKALYNKIQHQVSEGKLLLKVTNNINS